jgi:Ribbon-helix-helix protein, copG family
MPGCRDVDRPGDLAYIAAKVISVELAPMSDKNERITVRVDSEWLETIDDLRRLEKDVPTRAEYLRRAVMYLKAQKLQVSAA